MCPGGPGSDHYPGGPQAVAPARTHQYFKTRPASFYISIVTTSSVLIAGLMTGILVSVALAIILVLHPLARPHETIIRTPKVPGLLVYRFAGPLFFINAAYFANRVQELIDASPETGECSSSLMPRPSWIWI